MSQHITLEQARTVAERGLARATESGFAALAIAVLDPGGHAVVVQRQDGAEFLRVPIAVGKAYGALGMGHSGGVLAERADSAPAFFAALSDMTGGRVVPGLGGVLIRHSDGSIAGAVGVSGETGERDEECAVAGIRAAGLEADYGQNPEWRRS